MEKIPTLYEWAGGIETFERLFRKFYEKVLKDDLLGKLFGKMLTEEQRQRWVRLLLQTADEIGLKSDPEFRSALVGYLEWGSRIAVINSQSTTNPMAHSEPMPKWGWGETGGPYIPEEK